MGLYRGFRSRSGTHTYNVNDIEDVTVPHVNRKFEREVDEPDGAHGPHIWGNHGSGAESFPAYVFALAFP